MGIKSKILIVRIKLKWIIENIHKPPHAILKQISLANHITRFDTNESKHSDKEYFRMISLYYKNLILFHKTNQYKN